MATFYLTTRSFFPLIAIFFFSLLGGCTSASVCGFTQSEQYLFLNRVLPLVTDLRFEISLTLRHYKLHKLNSRDDREK